MYRNHFAALLAKHAAARKEHVVHKAELWDGIVIVYVHLCWHEIDVPVNEKNVYQGTNIECSHNQVGVVVAKNVERYYVELKGVDFGYNLRLEVEKWRFPQEQVLQDSKKDWKKHCKDELKHTDTVQLGLHVVAHS